MRKRILTRGILAGCAMLVLILDSKTAVLSARDGIDLCLQTVIPSLFPFFILSGLINSSLFGQRISLLRPLGKLCKIPAGSESLLLLGFLSGYPVGAQLITQSWQDGRISTASAKRMLGFCNNAGPAFLFGMLTPFFDNNCIIWTLWGIHILSGLLVGCILPADEDGKCSIVECQSTSLVDSLRNAICIMASVCGWIVVFRLIIGFCSRWFLWLLPSEIQILFCGILELANGCILLQKISCSGMRFIIASVILSFGGLCVSMQTLSVTKKLGSGWYFPGKLLQTLFSILLSFCAQILLFTGDNRINIPISGLIFVAAAAMLGIYFISGKKYVAFQKKLLYNNTK